MSGWAAVSGGAVVLAALFVVLLRWGMIRGSTKDERSASMPGDAFFEGRPRAFVAMTRAVSLDAPPEAVWPWIAQLGRGAGWYSVDWLDNRGRRSAKHLVSWIPGPALGDATAIGYVRHLDPGRAITWWVPGGRFLGATARLAYDIHLRGHGGGSRVVVRISADAKGAMGPIALFVFRIIDSIMATQQLRGLHDRVAEPEPVPESGARDQFQRYEVIYASGERAGVAGGEDAERWRRAAIQAGVVGTKNGGST